MARPASFKNCVVVTVRFEAEDYSKVQEIAALESITTGRSICASDLIREAVKFVYGDNERMRESFRKSRGIVKKRLNKIE